MINYLVVSIETPGEFKVVFEGTRSRCESFINKMVTKGKPTHFLYVVKNTDVAIRSFKRSKKIPLTPVED